MEYQPAPYQQYAEKFIIEHKAAGLFLDMGLGKTVVTLSAINQLIYDYFEVSKVLVIAPLTVAKNTWPEELSKWEHLKNLSWVSITGSQESRIANLQADVDIYLLNRENVPWLVKTLREQHRVWPFDMVVIDELSSFKSSKALRFKALKSVRSKISRFVGLTGTPAPNGLEDLWPQIYLLDGGQRLGRTVTSYRQKYFVPGRRITQTVFKWELRDGAEAEIYEAIGDICVSMKTEDHVQLPEQLHVIHDLKFTKAERDLYEKLKREAVLELPDGVIDTANAAVLTGKLLQMTGGAVYDEDKTVQVLNTVKLDAMEQLVEEANGQPVLVFYNYKHEFDRLCQRFPEAVSVKEPSAVQRWNSGEIPLMLAQPASAGHGLNLQHGGHIAIWYSLPWSLELYQQANKRLHRKGAKETVLIHHLLIEKTIDGRILNDVLKGKKERQEALLAAVKAEIASK